MYHTEAIWSNLNYLFKCKNNNLFQQPIGNQMFNTKTKRRARRWQKDHLQQQLELILVGLSRVALRRRTLRTRLPDVISPAGTTSRCGEDQVVARCLPHYGRQNVATPGGFQTSVVSPSSPTPAAAMLSRKVAQAGGGRLQGESLILFLMSKGRMGNWEPTAERRSDLQRHIDRSGRLQVRTELTQENYQSSFSVTLHLGIFLLLLLFLLFLPVERILMMRI
ncbi:uncharacterized protein LOC121896817 [Thunnus maccoyii]|uniref:uncharacterized protein LOC121896817 n=1 Tax=Thunnus maccoyii TaxID=8240 RepID=UPI001C4C1CFA|nr:uncharacterized protein LOC121896817 [Thunnus maccoyii]